MFQVRKITINYQENPWGVTGSPQFAWVMESDGKGILQTAYRLQILEEEDAHPVYDSGRVNTAQSSQIRVEGFRTESLIRYAVRVKVWNNLGEESPWSQPAQFLSALKEVDQWKAAFISGETEKDAANSKGTYLRGTFFVKKPVKNARMVATALGIYHPYLNGKAVGDLQMAPGWTVYGKRLLYQTYDVTDALVAGENVLGAHVGAGWYKGSMGFERVRNLYGKQTAFAAQILVRYQDGSSETFCTDETFCCSDSPVLFSEIYDGEEYDAAKEQEGWNQPGFEADSWKPVVKLSRSADILVPQEGCPVRELVEIPVKEVILTPQGDTVLDFGQNLTGWVQVRVHGKQGEKLELHHFETLDAMGNVYTENLRSAKQTVTYWCSGKGEETYRPNFTFQGFRYVRVASFPGKPEKENFTAYAVHSDMKDTGFFFCSHPLLNQLQHNISWGLKGNFLDIPTDCPQRDERLGWTGDAQIFCRTAAFLKNTYPFFSKWLKDLAADQAENGAVPHVIPDILSDRTKENWLLGEGCVGAAAWGDAAVIIPWTMYLIYGDLQIIRDQYDSMKGWITFMEEHSEDYIWHYALQFGDWVALDAREGSYFGATPEELICTAYFAYSTRLFSAMARAVGEVADAERYENLYEKIVDSYRRHFIKNGHLTVRTQTAQILTLYFELASQEEKPLITADLLELLREQQGHLVTGFVGTPYFCHALSRNGCVDEAYDLLLKEDFPSWLYQVKMGATTVWEHWDGMRPDGTMWSPDMNSFNHYAYGAVGDWLYRVAAGIEADEAYPGFGRIVFCPRTGNRLTQVKASFESIHGTVSSSWKRNGDHVELELEIPVNTTAVIQLEEGAVPEPGELSFACKDGIWCGEAGSGHYQVNYRKSKDNE